MTAGSAPGPRGPVAGFAAELRALRATAGNPSFRTMAGSSGCISHTTLHEAAGGTRFPSWETTREFVRACGGDVAAWRQRWEQAHRLVAPPPPSSQEAADRRDATPTPAVPGTGAWAPDADAPGAGPAPLADPVPADVSPAPWWRRLPPRAWLLAGAAGVTVAAVITAIAALLPSGPGTAGQAGAGAAGTGAAGPLLPGDRSRFIADVTIPDGTVVPVNQTFVKIWELQNSGTALWRGRYLERMDLPMRPDTCRTPERIPLGDTLPNERIKVTVTVTAPAEPGTCMVKWKMVDAHGRQFFPTARPVYFLVTVVEPAATAQPGR